MGRAAPAGLPFRLSLTQGSGRFVPSIRGFAMSRYSVSLYQPRCNSIVAGHPLSASDNTSNRICAQYKLDFPVKWNFRQDKKWLINSFFECRITEFGKISFLIKAFRATAW
jgi:hypothetical protein